MGVDYEELCKYLESVNEMHAVSGLSADIDLYKINQVGMYGGDLTVNPFPKAYYHGIIPRKTHKLSVTRSFGFCEPLAVT